MAMRPAVSTVPVWGRSSSIGGSSPMMMSKKRAMMFFDARVSDSGWTKLFSPVISPA